MLFRSEPHLGELRRFCTGLDKVRADRPRQVVAGTVLNLRTRRGGRDGGTMGFALIDDRSGRMEVSFFSEVYERDRGKIEKDRLVIFEGEVQPDDFTGGFKMRAARALTMEEARACFANGLRIDLCDRDASPDPAGRLKAVLSPYVSESGGCPVSVLYTCEGAEGRISLGRNWRIRGSDELLAELKSEFGDDSVAFLYAR